MTVATVSAATRTRRFRSHSSDAQPVLADVLPLRSHGASDTSAEKAAVSEKVSHFEKVSDFKKVSDSEELSNAEQASSVDSHVTLHGEAIWIPILGVQIRNAQRAGDLVPKRVSFRAPRRAEHAPAPNTADLWAGFVRSLVSREATRDRAREAALARARQLHPAGAAHRD